MQKNEKYGKIFFIKTNIAKDEKVYIFIKIVVWVIIRNKFQF